MKQLSEFDTLEEAQNYVYEEEYILSGSEFKAILCADDIGLYNFAKNLPDTITVEGEDIQDNKAQVLKDIITSGERISFFAETPVGAGNLSYLDTLIGRYPDKVELQVLRLVLEAESTIKTQPYQDATLLKFNQAKGFKSQSDQIDWPTSGVVTVSAELPERSPVALWAVREGRYPKNIGRSEYLQSGSVDIYIGDIRVKYPNTEIVASIPFEGVDVGVA